MALVVYNTMTQKKEEFVPLKAPKVGMYVCGITAYDTCHLGHARAAVVFDMIYRHLKHRGFDVTYVRNYTDVDDKIINRANKEGRSCEDITRQYIGEYEEDMASLGVLKPDIMPRATGHIPEMIATIEKLISRGIAYEIDGDVYFSVRKFPGYGKLSKKNIEELESGARVEVDERKKDPLDFALWKSAKPGEPKWPSPWGEGRPGWHIECSAMSSKYLGQPFDIHGGGRDLIFPHHENEIAQAEGACGCEFVRYWLHNGFININAEKMSKSLGNITAIREVIKHHDSEAVRLFILSSHYRSPLDYTEKALAEAGSSLDRFYETAERLHAIHPGKSVSDDPGDSKEAKELREFFTRFDARFDEAMDDDFNTARATGLVFEAVRLVNKFLDNQECPTSFTGWTVLQFSHMQQIAGAVLGVFGSDPAAYRQRTHARAQAKSGVDTSEVERLIAERKAARASKDFKRADAIRDELAKLGVEFKDKPDGTTEWKLR
ncbi:MAG: cysteine--tRNA ligase [bacterium]